MPYGLMIGGPHRLGLKLSNPCSGVLMSLMPLRLNPLSKETIVHGVFTRVVEPKFFFSLTLLQGLQLLKALRRFSSGFNTVFVPLLLLAAGVGFPPACF